MSDDTTMNTDGAPMPGADQPEAKPEGENQDGGATTEGQGGDAA